MKLKILALALLILTMPAFVYAWSARVVFVQDGDIIAVEPIDGGDRVRVRLWGIDCPEFDQHYGSRARSYVTDLTLDKIVVIEDKDKDRYGRTVAIIKLDNGEILQQLLLKDGLAWVYRGFCQECDSWIALEIDARELKQGLWKDDNPIPPWEWESKKVLE